MRLNFFLDIDGTLVPFGKPIPQSSKEAILKAKSLGHRVFLGTGRAPFEVQDEVNALPLDGGVFSAGADIIVGGKQIFLYQASQKQRKLFFDVVKDYDLIWLVQGNRRTFTTRRAIDYYEKLCYDIDGAIVTLKNIEIVDSYPEDEPLTKAYILSESGRVLEARKALEGPFNCVNNTTGFPEVNAAEVMLSGMSKSSGIGRLIDYLGDSIESTVAIGDGENDLDMVQSCALGIAMGNACQVLKDHADHVTDHVDNDGLAKAICYAIDNLK